MEGVETTPSLAMRGLTKKWQTCVRYENQNEPTGLRIVPVRTNVVITFQKFT